MGSSIGLTWQSATTPKAGHQPGENEDALAADEVHGRFALADGASEGWQSGPWAIHLVAEFVASPPEPTTFAEWVRLVRQGFTNSATKPSVVSWYAETKQAQGAFSTLLGLSFRTLQKESGLGWKGFAIGDSCVFQFRRSEMIYAFPVDEPQGFTSTPDLIGSAGSSIPEPQWIAGRAEPGDEFLLATDAVSEWLVRARHKGRSAGELLREVVGVVPSPRFAGWVDLQRTQRLIRNDDSTVVYIRVGSPTASESPR